MVAIHDVPLFAVKELGPIWDGGDLPEIFGVEDALGEFGGVFRPGRVLHVPRWFE